MSKSVLYAVNTNEQTVAVGGTVNFGQPVRRFGCNCRLVNGNGIIHGDGYYKISAAMILTPAAAGELTVTLLKDGAPIPGATYSQEVTTDTWEVAIDDVIVREIRTCCDTESTITAVISTLGATVSDARLTLERI